MVLARQKPAGLAAATPGQLHYQIKDLVQILGEGERRPRADAHRTLQSVLSSQGAWKAEGLSAHLGGKKTAELFLADNSATLNPLLLMPAPPLPPLYCVIAMVTWGRGLLRLPHSLPNPPA